MSNIRFDGQVAIVINGGSGIGRECAILLASRGAKVLINDTNSARAHGTADIIMSNGGVAAVNTNSTNEAEAIVNHALIFGGIHLLIITSVDDDSTNPTERVNFEDLSLTKWNESMSLHLKGAYNCARAVWSHFVAQNYGRIVFLSSPSAFYGVEGNADFIAAKRAIVGLANVLSLEGKKRNIFVNTVSPITVKDLPTTNVPEFISDILQPRNIAPLICYLSHSECEVSGAVLETTGTVVTKLGWERSTSAVLRSSPTKPPSVEDVAAAWGEINSFQKNTTFPESNQDAFTEIVNGHNRLNGS